MGHGRSTRTDCSDSHRACCRPVFPCLNRGSSPSRHLRRTGCRQRKTSRSKYKAGLKANVPEQATNRDLIYGLRCSLLHQGKAHPHGSVFPLAVTTPISPVQIHRSTTIFGGQQVGWMSLAMFVDEVTRGAEQWLANFGTTARVQRNLEKFARLRMEGLPPHVVGTPVFA